MCELVCGLNFHERGVCFVRGSAWDGFDSGESSRSNASWAKAFSFGVCLLLKKLKNCIIIV